MAYTGYPAGSPQAPQSGIPGGGLVPAGFYQQGTAAPVMAPSLDGAGQAAQANPAFFQNLLNTIGVIPGLSKGLRYGPGAAQALGAFSQGDLPGAIGATAATVAAGRAMKGLGAAIPNPLVRGAVQLAGSALAAPIGAQLARGGAAIAGQLVGGGQSAVQDVVGAVTGAQREAGQSGITGREVGLGGASATELDRQTALLKQLGVNLPAEALAAQYQITQKYKDADMGRQMQLNQQLGQLTGALNRQTATYQLGSQALGETSATTRQILASNPYQASVLQTGNVRGIY